MYVYKGLWLSLFMIMMMQSMDAGCGGTREEEDYESGVLKMKDGNDINHWEGKRKKKEWR